MHIVEPVSQFAAPQGSVVYFAGEAYDDAGNRLSPKQLQWFDDKTPIGSGERFSNSKLEPRTHTIQLLAQDDSGRTSVTTQIIEITPSGAGNENQKDSSQQPSNEAMPNPTPAGSTILVPEQAFPGGVLTGVVLGPDDEPVANTPVQIAGGGVPGDLSGEVVGDEPNQPPSNDKTGTVAAGKQPASEKTGTVEAGEQPGPLATCAENLKAIAPYNGKGVNGPSISAAQPNDAAGVGGSPADKNPLLAQAARMIRTDAQGRFALCVLPDAPKVAVNLPALPGKDSQQPGGQVETKVVQTAAAEPVPQPPFPRPPDFVQPGEKFTVRGNFPKADYEQSGQKGKTHNAKRPCASVRISTFKAPQGLKPGAITFHLTDPKGKQTSYTGGIFKILRASLDRSQLHSNQGADFTYEVLASPESVPDGLCVDIKLLGPIVMVQPPPLQVPLDPSGYGKFGGKIRATQVTPGSAIPFDIRTNFHSCKTPSQ